MPDQTSHTLAKEQELRFEVAAGSTVTVTLTSGTAEIFGAEMALQHAFSFSGSHQEAIFTWHGCTLQMDGICKHSYVATETPMVSYMQLHADLEARRVSALARGEDGPRVLVAGPSDTGKASICRLLVNYAARCGHSPLIVELDPAKGEVAMPGCIAAVPLVRPLAIERDTEDLAPLAFWLGHASASDNVVHYKQLTSRLAASVEKRLSAMPECRAAGLLMSTAGWLGDQGLEVLRGHIEEFRADTLVVMSDDRLHAQLTAYTQSRTPKPSVIRMSKSGGVVRRSETERNEWRNLRWREYFYGTGNDLCPQSIVLDLDAIQVFSIAEAPQAPVSALPIGMKVVQAQLSATRLGTAQLPSLVHSVLAVIFCSSTKCDALLDANVAGVVSVISVDLEKQKITLLSPSPLPLPSNILLSGSLRSGL
mmetsp:Transcript_67924/g.112909  ORF Transcript_67924/g.112909 Transcript_67924/m.112909 type:complete len:423 (-) Transcript_67924:33-1301(-)